VRRLVLVVILLLLSFALVNPAFACINDRAVVIAEEEFKSSYLQPPSASSDTTEEPAAPKLPNPNFVVLGIGVILLAGAVWLCFPSRQEGI
jgi:hypothetical protein